MPFTFVGPYSFMYGPAAKAALLHMETSQEQMQEFRGAVMHALMAGAGPMPFLYLRVSQLRDVSR